MKSNKQQQYPLTQPQKRIWYLEKIYPDTCIHNIGGIVKFKGQINQIYLEIAINHFIRRNEGIRLRFFEQDDEVGQYIKEFKIVKLPFYDLSKYENPIYELNKIALKELQNPFTLYHHALYSFSIYKMDEQNWGYLIKLHHLISDGWSVNILTEQICKYYQELVSNQELEESTEYSYVEYIDKEAEYFSSNRFEQNKSFWNEKLKDLPNIVVKTSTDDLSGKRKTFYYSQEKSIKIKKFIKDQKISINILYITVYLLYRYKIFSEKDIIVVTPVLNRIGRKEKSVFGMFTSTMPMRIKIDEGDSIKSLMVKVAQEIRLGYMNQRYPFNFLMHDLEIKKQAKEDLFDVSINCYSSRPKNEMAGIALENTELYNGLQAYSLQIIVKDWSDEGCLSVGFDYKTKLYTDLQIDKYNNCLNTILDHILDYADDEIKKLIITKEQDEILFWNHINATEQAYNCDYAISKLFEEQVSKTPNRTAACLNKQILTYDVLNKKSNQLGRHLIRSGVSSGSVIAIMTNHSFETLIGILGILKAGATYLPIDPLLPYNRIEYILEDSKVFLMVVNVDLCAGDNYKVNILDLRNEEIYQHNNQSITLPIKPDDLAYIIYTSGSTGVPKGVMIKQQGLVNYILWAKKQYIKSDIERFPLYSSLAFDLTVTSIFTPLISGGEIVIYQDDGEDFILNKILDDAVCTVLKLTPAHLSLIQNTDNCNRSVKRLIVGGENLKTSLAKKTFDSFGGAVEIFNEYGPTETVVGCMIHKYNPDLDNREFVPIGIPADNVRIYIVDQELKRLPKGVIGEICIAGDGVAKGYINQPELTKERFVPAPYLPGQTMYRTGDLALVLDNGLIEYVGREDTQVKLHGYRIELSEIEAVLIKHEKIKDAVVTVSSGFNSNQMLSAYVILTEEISVESIRVYLIRTLPQYMVPTYIIQIDKIPLTINGKVDRTLLPSPERKLLGCDEAVELLDKKEKDLVSALKEVLGTEKIGLDDNFYHVGGDSVKAIQLAAKMRVRNLKISVNNILNHPNIRQMFLYLEDNQQFKTGEITDSAIEKTPIVSWFFAQNFRDINHYNQSVLLEVKSDINLADLEQMMNELLIHHDMLRANYSLSNQTLFYNHDHLEREKEITEIDLSSLSYESQILEMKRIGRELKAGFNIEEDLLFRTVIFNLGERGRRILMTAHHLIIDAVSWRIILDDLQHLYLQKINNSELKLLGKSNSYQEWANRLSKINKSDLDKEWLYWESMISSMKTELPCCALESQVQVLHQTVSGSLNKEHTQSLLEAGRLAYGMKTDELLIAALLLTWEKEFATDTLAIELEGHGRNGIGMIDLDLSKTVGWFTSIYPVVFDLQKRAIDEQIYQIREQLRSIPNNGFGYGILKYLYHEFDKHMDPCVRFNYIGDLSNTFGENAFFTIASEETGEDSSLRNHIGAQFVINCMVVTGVLMIDITYYSQKYSADFMTLFLEKYIENIKLVSSHCKGNVSVKFTPEDFGLTGLSQASLDSLFQ